MSTKDRGGRSRSGDASSNPCLTRGAAATQARLGSVHGNPSARCLPGSPSEALKLARAPTRRAEKKRRRGSWCQQASVEAPPAFSRGICKAPVRGTRAGRIKDPSFGTSEGRGSRECPNSQPARGGGGGFIAFRCWEKRSREGSPDSGRASVGRDGRAKRWVQARKQKEGNVEGTRGSRALP